MEHRYPNESPEYRQARDAFAAEEEELVRRVKAVAEQRRNLFTKVDGSIFHFWGTEIPTNDLDMIWLYLNPTDLTPAGRPDRPNPPQNFRSRYLEEHYPLEP